MSESPTLSKLAAIHGARFTFRCRPCDRLTAFEPAEILAAFGGEITFANLRRRMICKGCRMALDGEFRTFEFSSTDYLHKLQQEGYPTYSGGF